MKLILTATVHLLLLTLSFSVLFATPLTPPRQLYNRIDALRQHPGFFPFISHLDFRKLADFVIDQDTEFFDPNWVRQGDLIYVNIWFLPWFEEKVHDRIPCPYLLISCDVGDRVPIYLGSLNKLLFDPKCAAWFARNMIFSYHPKLHQIPMGQDLTCFVTDPSIFDELKQAVREKPFPKKYLLYMNHSPRKYGDRDKIVKLFEHAPYCFSRNTSDPTQVDHQAVCRYEFYKELGASKFTLSPLGWETDCVRTWEALAMDCIPIVEHTFLDPHYEGLPVLIVHDWTEITEDLLLEKYEELKNKSTEKAYFDYWSRFIRGYQEEVRKNHLSFSSLEATQFSAEDLRQLVDILEETGHDHCIYRGFAAALHPLQIANASRFIKRISFYDPWLHPDTWDKLDRYLNDRSFLHNKSKISFLRSESKFHKVSSRHPTAPLFLDLTYYRNGLILDPSSYRHSLKKDLESLYQERQRGALLCGNMAQEPYVKKVLALLVNERRWKIEIRDNFWRIIKS